MKRPHRQSQLRRVLVVAGMAALPALAGLSPMAACAANDIPPACVALANCCLSPDNPDPSSCNETAVSGEETDAQCGSTLANFVASGACYADGGYPEPAEGGAH